MKKETQTMSEWTTLISGEFVKSYGLSGEIHSVFFVPEGWSGGPMVSMLIPECETQYCFIEDGELTTIINRPENNKNIKHWFELSCEMAIKKKAALTFACNTRPQAEAAAILATPRLPNYERVTLERMMGGKALRKNLS